MLQFLVRDAKSETNPAPKTLGLLRVHDAIDLFQTMDEWDNPNDYEYLRIIGGGGVLYRNAEQGLEVSGEWGFKAYEPTDEDMEEFPEDKRPNWKTFVQLIKQPFAEWYRHVYLDLDNHAEKQIYVSGEGPAD